MDYEKEIGEIKNKIEYLKGMINSLMDNKMEEFYSEFDTETEPQDFPFEEENITFEPPLTEQKTLEVCANC